MAAARVASTFHLGRPARAWRAVLMWRTSWLSREVIVLPAFIGLVGAWAVAALAGAPDVLVLMNAQTGEVESVKHELDERDRAMIKGIIK